MNKSLQIKQATTKIDIDKLSDYLKEHPQSKTLKKIIRNRKVILDSNNEEEIFNLGYYLDTFVNKTGYVKEETEKKHWLETSRKLFENTIGVK